MYLGNQQYIVTNANGHTLIPAAYPPEIVSHYVYFSGNYPNQAVAS